VDIAVLGCYINPSCTDKDSLKAQTDYFIENLKYARYMNAGAVGLETGYVGDACIPENNHTEEAYGHLLTTMKYLRDNAEKLGVTVAVEGVSAFVIDTPEKMLRLVKDLNSPNIAVIFDLLNLLTVENYKEQEKIIDTAFELLGDRIAVIHLKDFILENNSLRQCEIGKGICNIPYLLSVIKDKKLNLPIILEETKEERAFKTVTDLKDVMDL
ncbi:MAG: sugar phosphate isomerase/epimerase, partial [Clostridia bacterium]|nr:sugar phosphate isomerase/epimerase [Clostridia bacterium]